MNYDLPVGELWRCRTDQLTNVLAELHHREAAGRFGDLRTREVREVLEAHSVIGLQSSVEEINVALRSIAGRLSLEDFDQVGDDRGSVSAQAAFRIFAHCNDALKVKGFSGDEAVPELLAPLVAAGQSIEDAVVWLLTAFQTLEQGFFLNGEPL